MFLTTVRLDEALVEASNELLEGWWPLPKISERFSESGKR